MPNWVHNTIICKKNLAEHILNEKGEATFSILIPEPQTPKECVEKYGKQYIDNGNAHLMHTESDSWFNWYDWHCKFWGTKWNACDTETTETDELIMIAFDTAWSPPNPWIEKLASLNEPFIHHWMEEQGFGACTSFNSKNTIFYEFTDCYTYNEETDECEYDGSGDLPTEEEIQIFFNS